MASVADLTARFPELASTPEATLQAHLDAAQRLVSVSIWGPLYTDGVIYLAAHLAAFSQHGGGRGATSVSAGSAAVTYGDPMQGLEATSYGAHYRFLCRLVAGGPRIVG